MTDMVITRIIALLIGYVFGLFLSGYLFGKAKDVDIRTQGSGNVGTTNTMRILGIKAGAFTLLFDCLKCVAAVVVVWLLFHKSQPEPIALLQLYGAIGAILGHDFPFFMKFKGGKGIACSFGMIVALFPKCVPICVLVFVITVALTRYVSLGSILASLCLLVQVIVFGKKLLKDSESMEKILAGMEKENSLGNSAFVFQANDPEQIVEMNGTEIESLGQYLTGIYENRPEKQQPVLLSDVYMMYHRKESLEIIPELIPKPEGILEMLEGS